MPNDQTPISERMPEDHPAELAWPIRYAVYQGTRQYIPHTFATLVEIPTYIRACDGFTFPMLAWRERERTAQEYRAMPVWYMQEWWLNNPTIHKDHFVHVSNKNRALLAYTADNAKGQRDIQTPIKPGKYLTKYFGEILTPKQIAFFAAWQATGVFQSGYDNAEKYPLVFARTADEIEQVYVSGPDSCMSGDANEYQGPCHPVRVYAAGDLEIAYLHGALLAEPDNARPVARALVWPEKKIFGRIYPTDHLWQTDKFIGIEDSRACAGELLNRLMAEGYHEADYREFDGARLLRIECDDGSVVMPYLDRSYMFEDNGNDFVMHKRGKHSADGTDGIARIEPEHSWTCDNCNEGMSDDDEQNSVYASYRNGQARGEQAWCNYCTENHAFYCHGTEEIFWDGIESTIADGETVCRGWADDNCIWSDYSKEYHSVGVPVEMADGSTWTTDELAEHGFTCSYDGKNYPNDEQHPNQPGMHRDAPQEVLELEQST